MNIAEQCHVVNAYPAADASGAVWNTDVISMKNAGHITFILSAGTTGGTSDVTVQECDDTTPSNTTAIAFTYYKEETDAGDTLSDKQSATTGGFTTSANDNIFYVIEVDASQLSDGYPYIRVHGTDPGGATTINCVAILSELRYAQENTPTAIT
jgi:hypothetical protein